MSKYQCKGCNSVHTGEEWDKLAAQIFGSNTLASINEVVGDPDYHFPCPSCDRVMIADEITKLE